MAAAVDRSAAGRGMGILVSEVNVGQFVRDNENSYGVGKVVGRDSDVVMVEYFDSIADNGRLVVELPVSSVARTAISLQRRCYWQDGGVWRVGRVVWKGSGEYAARVPDSDLDIRVAE